MSRLLSTTRTIYFPAVCGKHLNCIVCDWHRVEEVHCHHKGDESDILYLPDDPEYNEYTIEVQNYTPCS